MRFIGHTRFSLFTPGAGVWLTSNRSRYKTDEEYKAALFSDERLEPRVDAFITEALPQIESGIGEHQVTHVVSYSDSLPSKYQQALETAAAKYPFVLLDSTPDGQKHADPIKTALDHLMETGSPIQDGEVFVSYRIDDDDLLGSHYFDLMAKYATPAHVGWNVSLGRGVSGIRVGDAYYELRTTYHTKVSAGLAEICQLQAGKVLTPKHAGHDVVERVNPLIVDASAPAFFYTHHLHQDSVLRHEADTDKELLEKVKKSMSWRPEVTEDDDLQGNFPAVAHKMHAGEAPI